MGRGRPAAQVTLSEIVGPYMNPPDNAVTLCVDEKSPIQTLDRTQPELPLARGIPGRQTHYYRRHGTTSLFAAFDIASGKVIGQVYRRHRSQEFLKFLRTIDSSVPTSASWINQVVRWFAILSEKQMRRGTHRSMRALQQTVKDYIEHNNENPKPFVWTKSADETLSSMR